MNERVSSRLDLAELHRLLEANPAAHLSGVYRAHGKRALAVRRQGFWNQRRPNLRESLAHLVGLIMRRAGGDASVAFRVSFV